MKCVHPLMFGKTLPNLLNQLQAMEFFMFEALIVIETCLISAKLNQRHPGHHYNRLNCPATANKISIWSFGNYRHSRSKKY